LYDVIKALDDYIKLTGKEVYLAYTLLNWINDSKEHAEGIFDLLQNHSSVDLSFYHVDLIPYNSSSENTSVYNQCNEQVIDTFIWVLNSKWISTSVRSQFWTEIDAGCWQLYNVAK
jgi:23S rRNA (adenine-C8)-methyltransferase